MIGERWVLSAGEYLVARACRRLPAEVRDERYREWAAELPVILHERGAGPATRRVARMLAFAVDTLRGTTLAAGAYRYHGAHRGGPADGAREIVMVLLVLAALPLVPVVEGWMVYQLINGPNLVCDTSFAGWSLFFLILGRIRRSDDAATAWLNVGLLAEGAGLSVRAVASRCGWGHPLLFAVVSYCGCALTLACFAVALILTLRSSRHPGALNDERVASDRSGA
jgi:hypothetical protein